MRDRRYLPAFASADRVDALQRSASSAALVREIAREWRRAAGLWLAADLRRRSRDGARREDATLAEIGLMLDAALPSCSTVPRRGVLGW